MKQPDKAIRLIGVALLALLLLYLGVVLLQNFVATHRITAVIAGGACFTIGLGFATTLITRLFRHN